MPTYEYRCVDCGNTLEIFQSFKDDPLTTCEVCAGRLRKVIHPVGIQFKGSGFYSTDRRASQPMSRNHHQEAKAEAAESGSEAKTDSKSDSKPAESKPAAESKKPTAAPAGRTVEKSA